MTTEQTILAILASLIIGLAFAVLCAIAIERDGRE